jgi:hypothetical protein
MILDVTKNSESLVLFSPMFFSPDDRPPSIGDNENQSRDQLDLEFGSEKNASKEPRILSSYPSFPV